MLPYNTPLVTENYQYFPVITAITAQVNTSTGVLVNTTVSDNTFNKCIVQCGSGYPPMATCMLCQ